MDILKLARTQPIQGQLVEVIFGWNDERFGQIKLPFTAWIKFKRLLEKGVELDSRENHALGVKLQVVGLDTVQVIRSKPFIQTLTGNSSIGGYLTPDDREDEVDPDIAAAEYAAAVDAQNEVQIEKATPRIIPGLIRSLKDKDE